MRNYARPFKDGSKFALSAIHFLARPLIERPNRSARSLEGRRYRPIELLGDGLGRVRFRQHDQLAIVLQ